MNILILGSKGQIGSFLVDFLKKEQHHILEYDISLNINQDLRFPGAINKILKNTDFVFFLAFDVGGAAYLKKYQDSYEFISNNIKIMSNTFDALKKYNTPFIFASSSMSNMLYSSYGILKNIGEKYVRSIANGKFIRLWNVYGYENNQLKFHVISDFIQMAKNNNKILMKTIGNESRQFLYVEDCCECLMILMNNFKNIKEKELDVSSFEWSKIINIAEIISKNFNNCSIIKGTKNDEIQFDSLRQPSTNILKYWKPKTNLVDGIKKIIEINKNGSN